MSMDSSADDGLPAFDSDSSNPLALAENSSDTFKYLPLSHDNSEIRLLRIMPGSPGQKVKCNLETVAQSSAPDYKALSYNWGELSQHHEIFVNGSSLFVTKNLLAALKQLRHSSKDLVIWIDAICINQDSDNERSDQVRKMRTIYEGASEVLVWLGKSSRTSSRAFSYIRDMMALLDVQGNVDDFIGDPRRYDNLMALHSLLLRDYWKRMWVIQETYVAKVVTVHCGADSIGWTELLATQNSLMDHESAMIVLTGEYDIGMTLLNKIWKSGARGMKPAEPLADRTTREPTLYESLLYHSSKLCSYPIDRVYSIVGLTSARFDGRFVIDYNRGARRVFIDVAQYTIATAEKLDIICALQPVPGSRDLISPDLPSWVPDWAATWPYENSLFTGDTPSYYAAATTSANATFGLDGNSLIVKGFTVGNVSAVGSTTGISSPWETNNTDISSLLLAFHSWRAMLMSQDGVVSNDLHISFRDTITCAMVYNYFFPGWSVEKYLEELMGLYGRLCEEYHPELVLDAHWSSLAADISSWESESHRNHWARTAILNNKRVLFRRRFFLAEPRQMGVTHEDVIVGDKICILYGIRTPVVLRPVDSYYTLVGETFVSGRGYMFGTAVDELTEGKHKEQVFEIH
jgi:hypothetical protein